MRRTAILACCVAAAAAAIVVVKDGARRGAALAAGDAPADDPVADAERACAGAGADGVDCATLRGRVRARVLLALDELAYARDVRGAGAALEALDVDDPEVQRAALRVLRALPPQAGVAKALPLLLTDRPVLREAAARVLVGAEDADAARIAQQLLDRGGTLPSPRAGATARERDRAPTDVAALGFEVYPGATRYPPSEAVSAAGFASRDPIEQVAAFYARKLGAAMDERALGAFEQQAMQEGLRGAPGPDDPDMKELQRLAEAYGRTQDPALMGKLQAVQERMQRRMEGVQQELDPGALATRPPRGGSASRTLRAFIAEKRGRKVARLVYVYREDALGLTVIEPVWDPKVFPPRR